MQWPPRGPCWGPSWNVRDVALTGSVRQSRDSRMLAPGWCQGSGRWSNGLARDSQQGDSECLHAKLQEMQELKTRPPILSQKQHRKW